MSEETIPSIFEDLHDPYVLRRKFMIPKWIRFLAWVFAIICPLMILFSICSMIFWGSYSMSIYGLQTNALISLAGLMGLVSFLVKGTAAIGLLTEKDWAVKMAIADGILGIALCIFSLIAYPWITYTSNNSFTTSHYNFRLELLFLIPYLVKMFRIRTDWEENKYALQHSSTN